MNAPRFYLTTAIDYPNSRPHIGTAFEKLGADVQARYRRMQGYDVVFLMGTDENTVKVSKRAAELGMEVQAYCDDMARQFREVWDALGISYDIFIQTSHARHRDCCRKFIQKVYDNGHIYKGPYEGWYCDGCEEFKTDKQHAENDGKCPNHKTPLTRRSEQCYFFRLSAFADRLLDHYRRHPEFVQPDSRRNELISLIENEGLKDINISRYNQSWGIRIPFDEDYTIYVWFDALLTYVTGIGYGDDRATYDHLWPADIQFIGKDITRFHCALWPAMLWAAGEESPRQVFGHGFVYFDGEKMAKTLGNIVEPMDVITKFSAQAFRYYFMRECPFPSDGDFSWKRFFEVYNADLANNLGNLFSRMTRLAAKNHGGVLPGTAGLKPNGIVANVAEIVARVQGHVEACRYHQALQTIWLEVLNPANKYVEEMKPWSLFKTDPAASARVLYELADVLRLVSIVLKPFMPEASNTIYTAFNFAPAWDAVRYEDAMQWPERQDDLRLGEALATEGVKPLFPRID
ncbi:MAG: methionine--tRNA ligase [Planctomycetia bacterium]|nr:methionine--tRNA ligase [Planctomycetia bacterium]